MFSLIAHRLHRFYRLRRTNLMILCSCLGGPDHDNSPTQPTHSPDDVDAYWDSRRTVARLSTLLVGARSGRRPRLRRTNSKGKQVPAPTRLRRGAEELQ